MESPTAMTATVSSSTITVGDRRSWPVVILAILFLQMQSHVLMGTECAYFLIFVSKVKICPESFHRLRGEVMQHSDGPCTRS